MTPKARYFVSEYTDGPATRWNVIDRNTQEWVRRFPTKEAAEAYIEITGNGTSNGRTTKPELTGSPCGTPQRAGEFIPPAERWVVGKNGWDASDEITREDI